MANQEQLDILKQGVLTWGQWREKHPNIIPNLSNADLDSAHLQLVDFSNANLSNANLNGAVFAGANLGSANLYNADLSNAYFNDANLSDAVITGVNLSNAVVGYTSFGDIDLSVVKNLESVRHEGPSSPRIAQRDSRRVHR